MLVAVYHGSKLDRNRDLAFSPHRNSPNIEEIRLDILQFEEATGFWIMLAECSSPHSFYSDYENMLLSRLPQPETIIHPIVAMSKSIVHNFYSEVHRIYVGLRFHLYVLDYASLSRGFFLPLPLAMARSATWLDEIPFGQQPRGHRTSVGFFGVQLILSGNTVVAGTSCFCPAE